MAKLWKNGIATSLTDGTTDASVESVYVSGSDVYASGFVETSSSRIGVVWKNGSRLFTTSPSYNGVIFSITIIGSDLYASGYEAMDSYPYYMYVTWWKNGQAHHVTDGTHNAMGLDFIVKQ